MKIFRKYRIADAMLLEFAGKELEFLPEDIDQFNTFDPDLNNEKITLLGSTYESALTYGTDKTETGVLKKLTENLSEEFKHCIAVFKEVRYFAKKRFGDSPAIMKQFGLSAYRKARRSQPEMVVFMYELANTTEKYREDLLASGLSETVLDSIKTVAGNLEKANVTQEIGKDNRTVKTEDRIKLLNSLYDILLEFSEAAKMVFANNPAKRDRYILPHSKSIGGENNTQAA